MSASPRQRQRRLRIGLYALLGVMLAAALVFADWERIRFNFLRWDTVMEMFPQVLTQAAVNTLLYTLVAFAVGIVLALALAFMRLAPVAPLRWISTIYVEALRSVPALVTILLVAYGIPIAFQWRIPGGTFGIAAFALGGVAGAYMAETIRAGIEAVPRGQVEAARSLGMRPSQAMWWIILPQAFRIIVPPLTNEFVLLIKDTSLLYVAGSTPITRELTSFGRAQAQTSRNATPYIVAALAYVVITIPLTWLVRRLERRNAQSR
ncbi:MAG: amino acid ABC transporter permease [Acidimicrobiia bacterium]